MPQNNSLRMFGSIQTWPWPTWWRHQMETFSALLAICAGNSPVPVNSPHKGQWRGALMFTLICARIYGWVNNREAGDLRRYRAHYDVIVMYSVWYWPPILTLFKYSQQPSQRNLLELIETLFKYSNWKLPVIDVDTNHVKTNLPVHE